MIGKKFRPASARQCPPKRRLRGGWATLLFVDGQPIGGCPRQVKGREIGARRVNDPVPVLQTVVLPVAFHGIPEPLGVMAVILVVAGQIGLCDGELVGDTEAPMAR